MRPWVLSFVLRLHKIFKVSLLGVLVDIFWMKKEENWIFLIKIAHSSVFPCNRSQPVDFGLGHGLALTMSQLCLNTLSYKWVPTISVALYFTLKIRTDCSPQSAFHLGSWNEETHGAEPQARATLGQGSSWLPATCCKSMPHVRRKYIFVIVRHWDS